MSMNAEQFYRGVINSVMENVRVPIINEGYDEQLLQSIKKTWLERLNSQMKRSKRSHAHIEELRVAAGRSETSLVIEIPQLPLQRPAPEPIEDPSPEDFEEDKLDSSEEDEDDDDEEDEMAVRFKQHKKDQADAKKNNLFDEEAVRKELQEDPQEIEGDQESLPSDNETNLTHPEADDEIICMYESVKHRGKKWTIILKNCIVQLKNRTHETCKTIQCDLEF